jgi:glycosyltransferase involved in cell wall biosynthesis
MANQCEQLVRLLQGEGAVVTLVRTNAPYRPAWIGRVPFLRACFRLVPYVCGLWGGIGRSEVAHVFANSGWAWHLLAFPALLVARLRGVPAIVNYRGGQADEFLGGAPAMVLRTLARAALRITPSAFLLRVFRKHGLDAEVIPNIIDLSRFSASVRPIRRDSPHLIVTRNLEPIYDIPTALRAFARVRAAYPAARLTVAGSGPELGALQRTCEQLGLQSAVTFSGRIDNAQIAALYADADLMLNPSTADNMPISILEALACGVPVVSTAAGGIPDLVEQDRTALLVPVGDAEAMADAALRLLAQPELAQQLAQAGVAEVARYAWPRVRAQWQQAYWRVMPAIRT